MTARPEAPILGRLALFGAACGTVYPLLAWVFDLGRFATWALLLGLPLSAAVVATALVLDRTGAWPQTRQAVRAGALGGLLGTAGYDLFRVPFVYGLGLALLAPIDSYGVLLLDTESSSAWTGVAGWAYHTSNGVGFGVAYAVLCRGRHWGYGLAWAMVLESASVFTPFATSYGLRGDAGVQWVPILLAYCAHVPYGYAIGRAGQNAARVSEGARDVTRAPVLAAFAVVLAALLVWQRPLSTDDRIERGREVAAGPSAVVDRGHFYPQWLRVPVGGCVWVRNDDGRARRVGDVEVAEGETTKRCFEHAGVKRVKVDGEPFSGGFVIVDDQAGR